MKLILSVEPIRFPLTGIGRYTYELASHLQEQAGIDELLYFGATGFVPGIPTPSERPGGGYKLKRFAQQSYVITEAYRLVSAGLKTRALRGYDDHLYHGPNFFLPEFAGRCVATFHDLSPFKWAQCLSPLRARYLQKELTQTLKRADALITDSAYTRQELADYFSWPIERIFTVPLAPSPEFHPRTAEQVEPVMQRYGLKAGSYVLFVGTIEPRKNVESLLDAYSRLPVAMRQKTPLVLCGYQGWRSEVIHARIRSAQAEGWARYLGFIPEDELPLLFAGAKLFAFPSHYEGYGLPVLEAMSSGIPVVCSNATSLPEVAGNLALMCAPDDIPGLTELLHQGLVDDTWRLTAIAQGVQHASKYTWARCALETTAVYSRVLQHPV